MGSDGRYDQIASEVLNRRDPGQHGEDGALAQVLRLELRVQQRLLCTQDAVVGLHARCLGREVGAAGTSSWSRKSITDVAEEEVDALLMEPRLGTGEGEDLSIAALAEVTLSTHPRLRR